MKTTTKYYDDEARYFHDEGTLKAGSDYTCLLVISVDSALKKDENYYSQAFLKEFKYIEKEMISYITEDMEVFSSDCDEE